MQPANAANQQPEPVISAQRLTKRYHAPSRPTLRSSALRMLRLSQPAGHFAVRDVDLAVAPGQTLGVIGRNGSGKSTLLAMLAGLCTPTSGSRETRGRAAALLELGAGFHPDFTGRENAELNLQLQGLTKPEIRAAMPEVAEFAGIGEAFDAPVRTYSTGMFLRVAFAAAAVSRPDALFIDEALAVGDARFQQKCIARLRNGLAGAAKVIVSHDLRAIAELCDTVLLMDAGRAVFKGPPAEAIDRYTKLLHLDQPVRTMSRSVRAAESDIDEPDWTNIDASARTGDGAVRITGAALTRDAQPATALRAGDRLRAHVRFDCARDEQALIFGYLIKDPLGVEICGQNTAPRAHAVQAGARHAAFEFTWPDLKPGAYTLTLGIGRGDEPVGHAVACWAPSCIQIECAADHAVHGLVNGDIGDLQLSPISEPVVS